MTPPMHTPPFRLCIGAGYMDTGMHSAYGSVDSVRNSWLGKAADELRAYITVYVYRATFARRRFSDADVSSAPRRSSIAREATIRIRALALAGRKEECERASYMEEKKSRARAQKGKAEEREGR